MPAAGLVALLLLGTAYVVWPVAYHRVLMVWIKVPWKVPFIDWDWIPSAVRCWTQGVDVFVANTCFRQDQVTGFNYSPLWLQFGFLRSGEAWSDVMGCLIGAGFFVAVGLLPPPQSQRELLVLLLAALSSGAMLGIERGNVDILFFVAFVVGGLLLRRSFGWRLAGYALFGMGGLLKFYPFVALVVACKERLGRTVALAATSTLALMLLVVSYRVELALMVRHLPAHSIFSLQFGSGELPGGLGVTAAKLLERFVGLASARAQAAGDTFRALLHPVLDVAAFGAAMLLARSAGLVAALRRVAAPRLNLLVVGAALIAGCFFAGQSVLYRGVYLILTLPGLAELSRQAQGAARPGIFAATAIVVPFVLCVPAIETCLSLLHVADRIHYAADPTVSFPGRPLGYLLWLVNELAWWCLVTVQLAVVGSYVAGSRSWMEVRDFAAIRRREWPGQARP